MFAFGKQLVALSCGSTHWKWVVGSSRHWSGTRERIYEKIVY